MSQVSDDINNAYLTTREVSHQQNSPLNKIREDGYANAWGNEEHVKEFQGLSESDKSSAMTAEDNPLEEPWVNPVDAFTGGFVGTAKLAAKTGAKHLLRRSTIAGTTGAMSEFPIGTASDIISEDSPKLAMAFNVVGGMTSGVAIESKIEKSLVKALTKEGVTPDKKSIDVGMKEVKKNLLEGNTDDELTSLIKADVEQDIEAENIASIRKVFRIEDKHKLTDKAGNINLSKIDSEDDVKELITGMSRKFKKEYREATRGVRTDKKTKEAADKVALSRILGRQVGEALNAEEAYSARKTLVTSGEQLMTLAKKVGTVDASDADRIQFRKSLILHKAIQEQVHGATAEAGRALRQYQIRAGSDKLMLKNIEEITRRMSDEGDLTNDLAKAIAGAEDEAHLNRLADKVFKAKTSDVVLEVWINSLLSGPATHAVNALSNTIVGAVQIPERVVAAGMSKVFNSGSPDAIRFREAIVQTTGAIEAIKESFAAVGKTAMGFVKNRDVRQAMETLEDMSNKEISKLERAHPKAISAEGLELSGTLGKAADYIGHAIRLPGTMLGAEDAFFKSVGYRMEVNAQAMRQGLSEGLKGADLARRIKEIASDPPDNIKIAAIEQSRYQTFTNDLTGIAADFQKFASKHPVMRVITPFIRTPTNIMRFALERSVAAPLLKSVRADIAAGGARADLAKARMATGSTIMAVAASYAKEGSITGGGPADNKLKQAMYRTGWQPYSVKVGDKYYSYARLEPLGTLLGIAADYTEISGEIEDKEADEIAIRATAAIAQNMTSKTFMRGITEVISAFNDPKRYGAKYWENLAGTVVPTGVAQWARSQDPILRETQGVLEKIRSRIPGYSKDLPPRLNMWAEPITLSGGLGPDFISPIYTSREESNPVDDEIVRLGMSLSMPTRMIGGVELDTEKYNRYVEISANNNGEIRGMKPLQQEIDKLINSRSYQRMSEGPNGMKSIEIRRIVQAYRNIAQQIMMDEFGEIREEIITKKEAVFTPSLIR